MPELTSPELRERVGERLRRVGDDADGAAAAPEEASPGPGPAPYEASLDADGRLIDYFAHFAEPWVDMVRRAAGGSAVVAEGDSIADDFRTVQLGVVSGLMMRTLLEELHLRRAGGLLEGAGPKERYRSFRAWTNSPAGHRELLEKYPDLFRMVEKRVGDAARYLVGVIREVENVEERLQSLLPGQEGGRQVSAITLGEGDTHNGGKSVAQVVFTDGSRVLYKPHPVDCELGYNAFVSWMNDRVGTDLRTVAVLPTSDGGFVEFIPTERHQGSEKEYFAKIGRIAGILFLLKAVDIHFENVVSCAQGPVVVDAETLMTPRLRTPDSYDDSAASNTAALIIHESIVGSGLMPMVLKARDSDQGLDIGVVGYDAGQRTLYKNLKLHNPGRDDMYVGMALAETTAVNANLSVRQAADLPVPAQRDIIKGEFRRILEYAQGHPHAVMEAIETFLGAARFRYVNNPTVFYNQLLRMATHPDAIADPLVRAAVLNRVVLRTGDAPEIADEEVRQLAAGDVPYFSYSARSCALMADGRTVQADALAEPALETVRARVHDLDAQVIERELDLIDFSFVNKLPTDQEQTGFTPVRTTAEPAPVDRSRMVGEAVRIGERLLATMVRGEDRKHPATWIAPQVTTDSQSQWTPGTLGYDIYGGSPGPALVLAGLARATGRGDFADAARRVLDPIEAQLRGGHLSELGVSVGGMTGIAGTAYTIAVARQLLGEPEPMRLAEMARELVPRPGAEVGTDYVSGLSGTLAACMALHARAADGAEKSAVERAVRAIAAAQVEELGGIGLADARVTDYTGYAHGAMGIGPVLLQYGTDFHDPQVRGLGLRMTRAVLESADDRDRDWPRAWGAPDRSYGWCHGAPGLLLGALWAAAYEPSCVPEATLSRLAELTLARGFGNNPTYCHGDLASAEIITQAERQFPELFRGMSEDLYPRLFTEVVERYEERVDTKYGYSNSLLVGQSGFAWSVLRHLDPETCPSILRFA